MGWTSYNATHYNKNGVDRKAECDSLFCGGNLEILKSRMVGSTYYAAVKVLTKYNGEDENGKAIYTPLKEEEQHVFAAVVLTSVVNEDYFNFSYKDMDETECPYQYDCPESILKLLTPTESEYANKWREECTKRIERNKKYGLSKLPIGSKIRCMGQILTKCSPQYQFKTPFWLNLKTCRYTPKSRIKEFEIVSIPDNE